MAGFLSGLHFGVGVGVGVGRVRAPEAQPSPNYTETNRTPKQQQQSEEEQWNPKPTHQNIKGLTNQTGFIKGDANGLINLGDFTKK